ncbi:MAG TPA: glutaminase A [Rectinemataceae bacterium]|nr:glutaminase A [Rectinemataceae bacterium]
MQTFLDELISKARERSDGYAAASYIPALAAAPADAVGVALTDAEGSLVEAGDSRLSFTLQSVSKALALCYVLETRGEDAVFSRVGKEPTGDPFNSIIRLETSSRGRPFNPMINAGAIVVTSLMPGASSEERMAGFGDFASRVTASTDLRIDEEVFRSEAMTASRNRSIAWFLDELGLLDAPVDTALECYFRQCALRVDAARLSHFGACLALDGKLPGGAGTAFSMRTARLVKGLMLTCGLYDGSGEFCAAAGIPAKSGVGGGIVASAKAATSPLRIGERAFRAPLGIAAYGPALDERGNSVAALFLLRRLSEEWGLCGF